MKHIYRLIAKGLRDSKPETTGNLNDDYILLKHWNITVEQVVYELIKQDNKLNREEFLSSCNYGKS